MFKRVLVGIDEETRGRDAIALTRRLADADAEITFAHVHPPTVNESSAVTARTGIDTNAQYAEESRDLLASVAQEVGIDARTRWTGSPNVGAGLQQIASEIGAELLVVGTTGRSRLARMLLGNPTTAAISEADCLVAVAPPGYADRDHDIHRVGVAYDGTPPSEAGLSFARRLADAMGAELSAFEVVPAPHGALSTRRHKIERAVLELSSARKRIAGHDGVEAHVACGHTVEQLGGYSNTVDILVAGSRGAGPLALLLHPSTTAALTEVVNCPLLVLTRAAREREVVGPVAAGTGVPDLH